MSPVRIEPTGLEESTQGRCVNCSPRWFTSCHRSVQQHHLEDLREALVAGGQGGQPSLACLLAA